MNNNEEVSCKTIIESIKLIGVEPYFYCAAVAINNKFGYFPEFIFHNFIYFLFNNEGFFKEYLDESDFVKRRNDGGVYSSSVSGFNTRMLYYKFFKNYMINNKREGVEVDYNIFLDWIEENKEYKSILSTMEIKFDDFLKGRRENYC